MASIFGFYHFFGKFLENSRKFRKNSEKIEKMVKIKSARHDVSCMDHINLWGLRQKLTKLQPSQRNQNQTSPLLIPQLTSPKRNLRAQT